MVTEQEARDMWTSILAFQARDGQAQDAQFRADLAIAQIWYDTTIKPTLTWNNTQTVRQQFNNTLADRVTLEAIVPTNRSRQKILGDEIKNHTQRIRQIKA